jgi:hypothetical protein
MPVKLLRLLGVSLSLEILSISQEARKDFGVSHLFATKC